MTASTPSSAALPWSPTSGSVLQVEDASLHYAELGQGPTLLLLHGWGRSYRSWEAVMPHLASRCRVIAPDLPGFGASPRPKNGCDSYRRSAELLFSLMDQLQVGRFAVVGNCIGGALALQMALMAPKRVDTVALLAPLGYRTPISRGWRAVGKRGLLGRFLWSFMTPKRLSKRIASMAGATLGPEHIAPELMGISELGGGAPGLLDGARASLEDLAWQIDEVEPPTLVIAGTKDRVVPARLCADLAESVHEGQFEAVVGVGHYPQEELPEEVMDLLTLFIAGRAGRHGPDNFSYIIDS